MCVLHAASTWCLWLAQQPLQVSKVPSLSYHNNKTNASYTSWLHHFWLCHWPAIASRHQHSSCKPTPWMHFGQLGEKEKVRSKGYTYSIQEAEDPSRRPCRAWEQKFYKVCTMLWNESLSYTCTAALTLETFAWGFRMLNNLVDYALLPPLTNTSRHCLPRTRRYIKLLLCSNLC